MAFFVGLGAPASIIIFATFRFFKLEADFAQLILWVLMLAILALVSLGLLHRSFQYHKLRREMGGLSAQTANLRAALETAHNANRVAHSNQIAKITCEMNEILGIDYKYCTEILDGRGNLTQRDIEHKFDDYLHQILTHTTRIFYIYTLDECAACFKVLCSTKSRRGWAGLKWPSPRDQLAYVQTFGRDPTSRYKRSVSDKLDGYLFRDNSIFKDIIEDPSLDGYYFENDLDNPSKPYFSKNLGRRQFYNATAVAALNAPDPSSKPQSLGFLCVDNMKGGFDNDASRYLLKSIASVLYYTMGLTFLCISETQELSE